MGPHPHSAQSTAFFISAKILFAAASYLVCMQHFRCGHRQSEVHNCIRCASAEHKTEGKTTQWPCRGSQVKIEPANPLHSFRFRWILHAWVAELLHCRHFFMSSPVLKGFEACNKTHNKGALTLPSENEIASSTSLSVLQNHIFFRNNELPQSPF